MPGKHRLSPYSFLHVVAIERGSQVGREQMTGQDGRTQPHHQLLCPGGHLVWCPGWGREALAHEIRVQELPFIYVFAVANAQGSEEQVLLPECFLEGEWLDGVREGEMS